jgi:transketolase
MSNSERDSIFASTPLTAPELALTATRIRLEHLQMHFGATAGHIGSGLSCIDILAYLYWNKLRAQDRFILSKGHAASSLYATLHQRQLISDTEVATYFKDDTLFAVHPSAYASREIPFGTGSLGHGLSLASGVLYANKFVHKNDQRVFCLLSDGECNEGSVWEAALFASHHKLNRLTVLIDRNGIQGFGHTDDVLRQEPLDEKWRAFGFEVQRVSGHDFSQLAKVLGTKDSPAGISEKPLCIICDTVKGKGVSFMENQMSWHYLPMTAAQFEEAKAELQGGR